MSRWIFLAVAVIVLTAVATFLTQYVGQDSIETPHPVASESTGPQPKVEIDQNLVHEFGVMSQQKKDTHTWKIKNTGQGDLELWLEGKTTCSCTVASLEEGKKRVVKPGDTTTIDLDWNTKTFENTYSQSANIGTNDPTKPTFTLAVKGKVYPPVVVYPPQTLTFNSISNEDTSHARVAILSPDKADLKIKSVTSSRPDLIVTRVVPLSEKEHRPADFKGGFQIDVDIKPGMPLGQFHDELVVQTDHPIRPEVKVSIAGHVNGPISVVPDRLRLSNVIGRTGASQQLKIMVRGNTPTKFEVAHKPDKIQVAIAPPQGPATKTGFYSMTVTVPPGTSSGAVNGDIILRTDHPKVSEVKIPVNIFVSNTGPG